MTYTREIQTIKTKELLAANKKAAKDKGAMTLSEEIVNALDPTGTHVIRPAMVYAGTDGTMRCEVICKMQDTEYPKLAYVDFTARDFAKLTPMMLPPRMEGEDNGN